MQNNWKPEDFAAKETKVSSLIISIHSENLKPGERHLLSNVCSLQHKVSNLSIEKRTTYFTEFKMKKEIFSD